MRTGSKDHLIEQSSSQPVVEALERLKAELEQAVEDGWVEGIFIIIDKHIVAAKNLERK